ncbi:MAG: nucleotidyltransferase substrate binding protein [Methylobacter sp.]|nr:nucleotidyltransferase substrate binding protein [Methylobacter sp.]
MQNNEIRWIQRFNNFSKALAQLAKFIAKGDLNELEKQGLIQCFEYTYELAWNTLKVFYENQAETDIQGSKDAIRLAFKRGLIDNGEAWMSMIKSRTLTSLTYNEDLADQIVTVILNSYYQEFVELQEKLKALAENE